MERSKKVKFYTLEEKEEFLREFDTEIGVESDEGNFDTNAEGNFDENDLDLDTIRARSKSRTVKNIDEADEEGEEEDDEQVGVDEEKEMNWDTDESESESGSESLNESVLEGDDDRQIPLEPFNLKVDREEGTFDVDGFFIRAIDEDAAQDRWLSNLTRSDISKARRAHEKVEAERRAAVQGREEKEKSVSVREAYAELLSFMQPGQNVLAAIRSRSKETKSAGPRPPLNKNRLKKLQAASSNDSAIDTSSQAEMNRITELADLLMNRGNYGIYEETFEEISSKIK